MVTISDLEIFGDKGMIQVENNLHHRTILYNQQGIQHSLPLDFLWIGMLNLTGMKWNCLLMPPVNNKPMPVGAADGFAGNTYGALAAKMSVQQNRPVQLDEIKAL